MNGSPGDSTRFEIDPGNHRKDRGYMGCLSVWGLLMLVFTVRSLQSEFWPGVVFGGLMTLLVIPYAISQRNRAYILVSSPEGLTISTRNQQKSETLIRRNRPLKLTLEHVRSAGESDRESVATLNLWDTESGSRHILGLWIDVESKKELFERLQIFLDDNGFDVQSRNEIFSDSKTQEN